jgi:hypothetical protein
VQNKKHTSIVTTVTPEFTRHSPRNGFNGFLRALPGDRLVDTVASGVASAGLTPAPGCQDHTTSPSATAPFVRALPRPPHPAAYVRDDRETPLRGGGTANVYITDLGQAASKISEIQK